MEVQHLKILNLDDLKVPTAKQSNTWKGKKCGKEIRTLHSELFQNILTTEKVCKYLKKRPAFEI